MPQEITWEAYMRENDIPDPGADHGLYGPSGHISGRARRQYLDRRQSQFIENREGLSKYRAAINEGRIIDPTGRYKPIEQADPRIEQIAKLRRDAKRYRDMATSGMKPRKFNKMADEWEKEAAIIEQSL